MSQRTSDAEGSAGLRQSCRMLREGCNDLSGSAWFSLEEEMRPLKCGHGNLRFDSPKFRCAAFFLCGAALLVVAILIVEVIALLLLWPLGADWRP